MAHQHLCGIGGHHYECSTPDCLCFCDIPCETGDHSECPVELRDCPEHKDGINQAELEAVQESGTVPIVFPTEMPEMLSRATDDSKKYVGFCVWCGYGYEQYSSELEAEHFAYHCPDAPEQLKDNFRQRLGRRAIEGRSRCRKNRVSKN
jgi:hypothetical protein